MNKNLGSQANRRVKIHVDVEGQKEIYVNSADPRNQSQAARTCSDETELKVMKNHQTH